MFNLQYIYKNKKYQIVLIKAFSIQEISLSNIMKIHYHTNVGTVANWEFKSSYGNSMFVNYNTYGIQSFLETLECELKNFSVKEFQISSSFVWEKLKKVPSIKESYKGKQYECGVMSKEMKNYPQLQQYLVGYNKNNKVLIVEDLVIEKNLSLDYYEDFSSIAGNEYSILIVKGNLEVKGDITNFGNGGLTLHVLGDTKAKNLLVSETSVLLNSASIRNLTLGISGHGVIEINSLETRLLMKLTHSIEVKKKEKIQYILDQEEYENFDSLGEYFLKSKLLSQFVYEGTSELNFKMFFSKEFLLKDVHSIVGEIIYFLKNDKT